MNFIEYQKTNHSIFMEQLLFLRLIHQGIGEANSLVREHDFFSKYGCLPDTTAVLKDRENMFGDFPFAQC